MGGAVGITVMDPTFNPAAGLKNTPNSGNLTYRRGGDEHGIIEGPRDMLNSLPIGSILYLVPGHCDPCINFYDEFTACRVEQGGDGEGTEDRLVVTEMIPIEGRGPGF